MADGPVLLERDGAVARLTLNRPDAANAIDVDMASALADAAGALAASHDVRAVLLTGAGDRFCGGGDVRSFAASGDDLPKTIAGILKPLHEAVEELARLDAPVIAAVRGSAAGAGLSLLAGADLVLAAASTRLVMAYTAIGLIPDGGSTWYLPRAVGMRRALELSLTNRALTAQEALEWGLVTRVVDDAALDQEANSLAAQLAAGPTSAFGETKRLLRASLERDLEQQLAAESAGMSEAAKSSDGKEGVAAFVAKRPPDFTGH